jgi:predicted phage-related endonuclease
LPRSAIVRSLRIMIERRKITDREEWLRWRQQDVTASNVGALFNEHPYTTPLKLYVEKRGTEFPPLDPENKVLRRGRWMEPAVGAAVAELRPEWMIEPAGEYLRDPILKLGCTPDFYVRSERGLGVLQAKSVAPNVYERDWASGAEVPAWIVLQAATECMLAEAVFGAVAVLLVDAHAMDCVIHEFDRNPGAEHKIRVATKMFWDAVAAGKEPEPDFARDTDTIKMLLAHEDVGTIVDLSGDNELPKLLSDRRKTMDKLDELAKEKRIIDNKLRTKIGKAENVIGVDGWKITYRTKHIAGYVVEPSSRRELHVYDKRGAPIR